MEIPMANSRNQCSRCVDLLKHYYQEVSKCIELESESGRFLLNMQNSNFHPPIAALNVPHSALRCDGMNVGNIFHSCENLQDLGLQELERDLESLDLQGGIWKFGRCLVAHHCGKLGKANLQRY